MFESIPCGFLCFAILSSVLLDIHESKRHPKNLYIFQLQHRRQPNMQPCRLYWELEATEVGITQEKESWVFAKSCQHTKKSSLYFIVNVKSQSGIFHLTDVLDKLTETKLWSNSQFQKKTGNAKCPTDLACFSVTVTPTKQELCGQIFSSSVTLC